MPKFKVGDQVRCIDDAGMLPYTDYDGEIVLAGKIYTVSAAFSDGAYVTLENAPGAGWSSDRFELVTGSAAPTPAAQKTSPSLVPAAGILAVAGLMTKALAKYPDAKWPDISAQDHIDAALRHLLKRNAGEIIDVEFDTDHVISAASRLLMAAAVLAKESE